MGIYATLWPLGLYASPAIHRHGLEPGGLGLRYGVPAEGFVPYEGIENVLQKPRKAPASRDGPQYSCEEDALDLAAGSRTDVTLTLSEPTALRRPSASPPTSLGSSHRGYSSA